jgi:hypothetical protein
MMRFSRICWIWCGSANTGRQACGQSVHDADVGNALFMGAKRHRFLHDLIQIDGRPRRMPLPRERLQVADNTSGAFGGVVNRIEVASRAFIEIARGQAFRAREDGRQRIVQLVRNAGHRLAQRRQLFGLKKLLIDVPGLILEPLALRHVSHHGFDAIAAA